MEAIQLPLPLQFIPRNPSFLNFPLKSDAEVEAIRAEATSKFTRQKRQKLPFEALWRGMTIRASRN